MGKGYGYRVDAERLLDLLKSGDFIYKPVKKALAKVGQAGKRAAQGAAAVHTGQMRQKISYRVNTRKKEPRFVVISARAVNSRGRSYPRVLEFSPRHGHKGWMLGAVQGIRGDINSSMADAAGEIEREFEVGA
jgi:hypothetical protein